MFDGGWDVSRAEENAALLLAQLGATVTRVSAPGGRDLGIAIDADARVRRAAGGVIPGLYAAGATTGGIEGGPAIGYTGGLSKAAVFGFRAAQHAAGYVKDSLT